jgi:hypothetical protein
MRFTRGNVFIDRKRVTDGRKQARGSAAGYQTGTTDEIIGTISGLMSVRRRGK